MVETEKCDGDGDTPQKRTCSLTPEFWIQAGTLVIMAITMAGVFWYACVADKSLKQQIIATRAAKDAADAATSAAKTAHDALTLTQLMQMAIMKPIAANCQPHKMRPHEYFAVDFENAGKTPAMNVKSTWWYRIGGKDCQVQRASRDFPEMQPGDPDADGGGDPPLNIRRCLGDISHIMADAVIEEIEEGQRQLVLVGRIYYDDAIKHHHLKAFTWTYLANSNPNVCDFDYKPDNDESY
jgi:hypothetical protein